ncbi:MAG: metallopeptidase family protein [Patescibacteria group bacterium]
MSEEEFKEIAQEEWTKVPERFQERIKNVALLIEDEPSEEVRRDEGLEEGETLLGLYQGIPNTERGSEYGVGITMPDTITLYRLPLIEEAENMDREFRQAMRISIRETIWHELAHYFGHSEEPINEREGEGTNRFES